MSLQLKVTNRRQFLGRSALGAGSLLFGPLLLESCTDHQIPPSINPDPEPKPPLLGDTQIDWNDDAKIAVITGLSMVPEAGEILSGLVNIFWPRSGEDVWSQVRLSDQKIDANIYVQVSNQLKGLHNNLTLYLNELNNGNPSSILEQWIITKNLFVYAQPSFQSAGSQVPLLPLFVQFTNLYLALLRDGVAFGTSWGRTQADHLQEITNLQNAITSSYIYTFDTYNAGYSYVNKNTPKDVDKIQPFRATNAYNRQMTLTVLDFMNTWYAYDVTQYPTGTTVALTREIYTDPFGHASGRVNTAIPVPVPTQRPTNLTVWSDIGQTYAVQLTYPAGSGPGGVTQTSRMGFSGGSSQVLNIPVGNPIIQARATWGSENITSIQFMYNDGTITDLYGYSGENDSGLIGYNYEALSSVYFNGISDFILGDNYYVVFGFQYWNLPAATLRALRAIYVASPKEHSVADLAKAFPKLAFPTNLISEDLKTDRLAYWASIKARAKSLK